MPVLRLASVFALCIVALAQNPSTSITVDASSNRHPINPNIYGVAYGTAAQLTDLNSPLNRQGGNLTSRYNWQINAYNHDFDYFFESIAESSSVAGESGDTFISTTQSAGAQPMLTIPMIGWVPKLGSNRSILYSFSVTKYGAQQQTDPYLPNAGNGVVQSTGQNITGNDPTDANIAENSLYQQQWMQHLVTKWGTAQNGGLRYYLLDNEPSIWWGTHFDVQPTGQTMAQMRDIITDYASKIRATDSTASIVGPEEWGWSGYIYSGYDQQYGRLHGYTSFPDRAANGGMDYLPWLLGQLKQTTSSTGVKYLDIFSVHYYPQSGEFSNDTSSATQLLRNRSTRSLWDPGYVDVSWIDSVVQLIPRLKSYVSNYYIPGTPVAITEYNWGAESYAGGATAQADIFGIFGREGLDMATRWTVPDPSTPTYKAMKMYRNYDGNKSGFGDTSVSAVVPNPDNVSAFAAQRSSDGALTVFAVNKYLTGNTPITVNVNNFVGASTAQQWQLSASNTIARLADVPVSGGALSVSVPPLSVSLFIIPPAPGPTADSVSPNSGSGRVQTFAFKFSSPGGFNSLTSVYGLINSGLSGAGACFFQYFQPSNTFYLFTNAGNAIAGSLTPGSGTVGNSQCSMTGSGLTASGSGHQLTLSVPVTFTTAFLGSKTVYGYAANANANAGWQALGTWTPNTAVATPPTADSVSPNSGSGSPQTFAFQYTSANGAAYLTSLYGMINGSLSGTSGCFFLYYAPANIFYLYNDSGNAVNGTLAPGVAGTASNSQCSISGGPLSVSSSGTHLTVSVPVTFAGGFTGPKAIYGYAGDQAGLNSGWVNLGLWTPNTLVNTPPTSDSVGPASGSGAGASFVFKYSSANGTGYLTSLYGLINGSLSGGSACFYQFLRPHQHVLPLRQHRKRNRGDAPAREFR